MSLVNRASLAVEELISIRRDVLAAKRGERTGLRASSMTALPHGADDIWPTLECAEPFWWERPIVELVERSLDQLPRWTLRPELFPCISGFFLFARPVNRWPLGPPAGMPLEEYVRRVAEKAEVPEQQIRERLNDPKPQRISGVSWMRRGTGWLITSYEPLEEVYTVPMHWGDVIEDGTTQPDGLSPQSFRMFPVLGAALLFLEQGLAISSREDLDRPARRRLAKAEIEYPPLRVIRLRTPKHVAQRPGEETLDWQHRWLVRGHWRQQFYASDGSHRPLWIIPYVKGPEDKPLKTPAASVFAVVR